MKQWYQELFSNYAEKYEYESFVHGTQGEVDFIEKEIDYNKKTKILDIGCGTGRHAIELCKRGYSVTGVDLSDSMLKKAAENAHNEGLDIDFINADARNLPFENEFDLVIMICEGAFPLMETDEMNFEILKNAAKASKSDGKLIFTTLNGLYPLFNSVKDFINSNSTTQTNNNNTFDLMTFRDRYQLEVEDDNGQKLALECDERYYVPSEIVWLLKSLNFTKIDIMACKLGEFSRDDPLTRKTMKCW
ncbi:MAG: class I SAM-dependent methyltransferase [Methanobacteriaceae archaeon]|jgi:2-polyprenyl-3-methyl-5-hydroxy-6-metoxy-1,4-benzoquinol methylase|nr:class I SAM-dependent methyltransferase [Methanobacteriaceae archaeon]MDP2835458.1 class I SAM-dependent methyltransferase [Methanobacteriaceae archaeon]MDP3034244.1 class I SAM-dependent methyltransferase [Methanobacteriaceae archaeon]MDP3485855.1 class I SAM-dependent methyltransferase [Methanobacteriaceae archaeon]MDP3622568.1 class I SAM-dependent methyltransferase [Methanobacteriaceae archaeon]